jgi:hypothetical protein
VVKLKTVPCWNFRYRIGDLAESEHDRLMIAIARAVVGRACNEIQLVKRRVVRRVSRRVTRAHGRVEILWTKGVLPKPDGSPGSARNQRRFGYILQ